MKELEQTLDSREVAEMVDKDHSKLLRDLRRYEEQFTEAKIGFSDFFRKSEYNDSTGRLLPCYRITKKGCEFIAHKLTGVKGTIFTARYINRFHEMEDMLSEKEEEQLPWFIKSFRGKYIILFRDFDTLLGTDLRNHHLPKGWGECMTSRDFNGYGWKEDNEKFKKEYGFDYGDDKCMMYFYLRGVPKVIRLLENDKKITIKAEGKHLLLDSIKGKLPELSVQEKTRKQQIPKKEVNPFQICITVNGITHI